MSFRLLAIIAGDLLTGATSAMAQPQTAFEEYNRELRALFWEEIYADGGETLYCGIPFKYRDDLLNIEHVFPVAWMTRHFDCGDHQQCLRTSSEFNRMRADLHILYPTVMQINENRGSLPFGLIDGERWVYDECDFEVERVVEPRPEVRGDIARAMFHMAETYGAEIFSRQRRILEEWHEADPPSDSERRRHERIAELQGTRNRFIDAASQ